MKLMVVILNKTDVLDIFLEGLAAAGIAGATIINSAGLASTLAKLDSSFLSASLRSIFDSGSGDNHTIISVIKEEQMEIVKHVVEATIGDLSKPNTGILFTIPIDYVDGFKKDYSYRGGYGG